MKTSLRRRAFLAPLTLLGVGHWLASGARAAEDRPPRGLPDGGAFSAAASEALQAMTRRAKELGVQGVAVVAYAEGERVTSWSSKMVVVGSMKNAPTEGNPGANLLGIAYANLGDARRAIGYYEQHREIACEIGDRHGEGAALGNLGNAYLQLGNARRAIGYYEQSLETNREIGDVMGVANTSFNLALLHAQQGALDRGLPLAQQAAEIWGRIGSPYAQRAQQLVAQLQGRAAPSSGPTPAQILQHFASVIEAVVVAAHGHRRARAAVEGLFNQLEQGGWHIVDPIRRIWTGERDEATLTAGLDDADTLIVREILKQLET